VDRKRKVKWLGVGGAAVVRAWSLTWRIRDNGLPPMQASILGILHGCTLLPMVRMRKHQVIALVSHHADGEIMAQALHRMGYETVRGSSTRGAPDATLQLLRNDDGRGAWVLAPDGPRGPRGSVKPGLIRLASASRRCLVPVAAVASPAKQFNSWDKFLLPMPFARVAVHYGEPMVVQKRVQKVDVEPLRLEFEERLATAEKAANEALANW